MVSLRRSRRDHLLSPIEGLPTFLFQRRILAADSTTRTSVLHLLHAHSYPAEDKGGIRRALARNPNSSVGLLADLAHDRDVRVRVGVAANPATIEPVIAVLSRDPVQSVREAASRHPLYSNSKYGPQAIAARSVARDPSTFMAALIEVLRDGGRGLYEGGWHTRYSTEPEALAALIYSPDREVRISAVSRIRDPELLRQIAVSRDTRVAREIAVNRLSPSDVLSALTRTAITGRPRDLAYPLAVNPSTPASALALIAESHIVDLRAAVAANHSANEGTLRKLAQDQFLIVMKNAVGNPGTPPDALALAVQILLEGGEPGYLQTFFAYSRPSYEARSQSTSMQLAFSGESPSNALCELARNPKTPVHSLSSIVRAGHSYRCYVAENPQAPAGLLEQMFHEARPWGYDDRDYVVDDTSLLIAIARNPNTSPAVLDQMPWTNAGRNGDSFVREAVISNPNTRPETISKIRSSWR